MVAQGQADGVGGEERADVLDAAGPFRCFQHRHPRGDRSAPCRGLVAHQVEHILGAEFKTRGYDPKLAELYSQALVGMVALTGRWWLEVRKPRKDVVAGHLVNLAWNGLSGLEPKPILSTRPHK